MSYVLIVDDEEAFRSMLGTVVAGEGHDVRTAASGEQALRTISRQLPSLVLLDLRMAPRALDGLQVLETLSQDHPALPVVMITGYGDI